MSSISIPTANIPGLSTANPSSEAKPAQMMRKVRTAKESKNGWWWGTGRRKRAVARVRIKPNSGGEGVIKVQIDATKFKTVDQYFSEARDRNDCAAPLKACNLVGRIDVVARCNGGGFMGQAQAVRLGIARALRDYDPTLEEALRNAGFLTRDAREVERKKPGQAGARRRFQFSKR
jgi:small subunit ribosomal protein S9